MGERKDESVVDIINRMYNQVGLEDEVVYDSLDTYEKRKEWEEFGELLDWLEEDMKSNKDETEGV